MISGLITALLLLGSIFVLLATVGILRMPDLLLRLQVSTKAYTLGLGGILLAVAVASRDVGVAVRALLVVLFVLLTAPVSAHMLGRAAYFLGVPLWERTCLDEALDQYDFRAHRLRGKPQDVTDCQAAEGAPKEEMPSGEMPPGR